jgi:hypothetical protein
VIGIAHGEEIVARNEGDAVGGEVSLVVGDLLLLVGAYGSDRGDEFAVEVNLAGAELVDVKDEGESTATAV